MFPKRHPQFEVVVERRARSKSNCVVVIVLLLRSRNSNATSVRLVEFIFYLLFLRILILANKISYAPKIRKMRADILLQYMYNR